MFYLGCSAAARQARWLDVVVWRGHASLDVQETAVAQAGVRGIGRGVR